jgi:hypothetical protein
LLTLLRLPFCPFRPVSGLAKSTTVLESITCLWAGSALTLPVADACYAAGKMLNGPAKSASLPKFIAERQDMQKMPIHEA